MELRQWLYTALRQVIQHGAYSNLYLKEHLNELDEKDRALATHIFYGTLQNYLYCQSIWKQYALGKVSNSIGILLTLSVYQMVFVNKIPQYAAVDAAVTIARKKSKKTADFVNAILRKVADNPEIHQDDPVDQLAMKYSLPSWIVTMWISQYGQEAAVQMAQSSVSILPVYVRINPQKMSIEKAKEEGLQPASNLVSPMSDLFLYTGTSLEKNPLYLNGSISVQDPGSYAIAALADPKKGQKVLDMCAAPGTKTIAMAEMMENEGQIIALDLHEHRAKLIAQDAKRTGFDQMIQALHQDATHLDQFGQYDVVLCDVPCSGYGVLARKPDMKLHLDSTIMDSLIPLQQELLVQAGKHVKPQGMIVYSTCTLNKKENEKQVQTFLKNHTDFTLIEEKTIFPTNEHNGFYMAKLQKYEQEKNK